MGKAKVMLIVVLILAMTWFAAADAEYGQGGIWEQETITEGFWGLNDELANSGMELSISMTNVLQHTTHGGTSTHDRAGLLTGSLDVELTTDLQRLLGIEGATLYIYGESTWPRSDAGTEGVGSTFTVNADAGGRNSFNIIELWWEQALLNNTLRIRFGKLDLTGGFQCRGCPVSFDGSSFANDETTQFLNTAFVNNPTIPFPAQGAGIIIYYNPVEWWYISGGVGDAAADKRETGLRTGLHGDDYGLYLLETGITPLLDSANGKLQGAYRFGMWIDTTDRAEFGGENASNNTGFYTSCDQLVIKENNDSEDTQGLGVFGRYGWATSQVFSVTNFWSIGMQYQGLLDGRDDDVAGIGYAQGIYSDEAGVAEDHESVVEVYYNAAVTPWLNLGPSLQYVKNPGGAKGGGVSDAVVLALRAQMTF